MNTLCFLRQTLTSEGGQGEFDIVCNLIYIIQMSGSVHDLPFPQECLKVVDMQREMVEEAFRVAEEALSQHQIQREVAKHIKKHFDNKFYPSWHCLVGKSFATVVTYESRHYIHFVAGDKSIVLFKFG